MSFEALGVAILAVVVWPAGIVIVALLLARRHQQAAVLKAVAEVVRAARGKNQQS